MREIGAVLFDCGGVLAGPVKHSIADWLAADAMEPDHFSATLRAWLGRDAKDGSAVHRLETGELTAAELDILLAAELQTADGDAVPDGMLGPFFGGMQPNEAKFALVEELRAHGLKVGLPSYSWGVSFEDFKAGAAQQVPVARTGTPEDVAHAVSFFASEGPGFVSGQVLYVAGGPLA